MKEKTDLILLEAWAPVNRRTYQFDAFHYVKLNLVA